MRGMGAALKGLVSVLGLPPWVVGLIFAGALLMIFSQLKKGVPAARARGLIVKAAVSESRVRPKLEKEALQIIWDDPGGLLAVAQEALRRDSRGTASAAVERLQQLGAFPDQTRALAEQIEGRPARRLEAEIVAIRNLLDEDLHDMARARLARAREAWPEDEALLELEGRLPQA